MISKKTKEKPPNYIMLYFFQKMLEKYCLIEILGVTIVKVADFVKITSILMISRLARMALNTCREMLFPNQLPWILQRAFLEIVHGDAWIVT